MLSASEALLLIGDALDKAQSNQAPASCFYDMIEGEEDEIGVVLDLMVRGNMMEVDRQFFVLNEQGRSVVEQVRETLQMQICETWGDGIQSSL